ncbi:MAG: L-aspartate oxidase [Chloroflexi bacterium]|nr:L-aspartate oxidase [Chloroflexota bacterium]MDA1240173.1 L-aspartate oxidase [Chloroflexota bacterium]
MTSRADYDLIVVGSGIAGLYAAIQAKEEGARVLVVTKAGIGEASTRYAQGGIAAAVGEGDSPEEHLQDTLEAGAGLVDEEAARILVYEAADRIADLVRYGVQFDSSNGEVSLGREAAHSRSRILHARGDATGLEIELSLSSLAQREVVILEHTLADRLLVEGGRIAGVEVFTRTTGEHRIYTAGTVVLATGGAGQMYRTTTNPLISTGDGVAIAYEAGAEVLDMEFTQFHPTALVIPGQPVFLISEAVRGEGALLFNTRGERFMTKYDPTRAELAPRDVVARAAVREMAETGAAHVLLDITDRDDAWLAARFPQIYAKCLEAGLDMARDRVPVSPAAHYTMGGVRTNTWGETTLPGLFVVGEAACTGVHGANRLASNSLLETVVFAHRAVERLLHPPSPVPPPPEPATNAIDLAPLDPDGHVPTAAEVKELMWQDVGIVRSGESLQRASSTLRRWAASIPRPADRDGYELRSIVTCARLASEAALLREESRGAHYRTDFPEPLDDWRRHIVFRKDAAGGTA